MFKKRMSYGRSMWVKERVVADQIRKVKKKKKEKIEGQDMRVLPDHFNDLNFKS